MGILDEDITKVREATDIAQVIGVYTNLRRVGSRLVGLCPFHTERTPSFSVNAEKGLYHCFGCGASGDAITFVREIEQLDFVAAVERLAGIVNVTLRYDDRDGGQQRARRAQLLEIVERAAAWYHDQLLSPEGAAALDYLTSRGVTRDQVEQWRLGYAPSGNRLSGHLQVSNEMWTAAGLGYVADDGNQRDGFWQRVMFPIADATGAVIGFGGRIMPGIDGAAKYKNSPDGPLYAKSRVLYGLDQAKAAAVKTDQVVVCEGYTDVIALAAAGVTNVVATCGTALTDDHIRVLRRYGRTVVLALDGDEAGQAAVDRLGGWESRHDVRLAVAEFPPGADPADVAVEDPDKAREVIEAATPFLTFQVRRVLATAPRDTAEDRARAAADAAALVGQHPDELVRDALLMSIADQCRVDVNTLRRTARRAGRRGDPDRPAPPDPVDLGAELTASEDALLRLLVQLPNPTDIVHPVLLTHPDLVEVHDLIVAHGSHSLDTLTGTPLGNRVARAAASEPVEHPADVIATALMARLRDYIDGIAADAAKGTVETVEAFQAMTWAKATLDVLQTSPRIHRDQMAGKYVAELAERLGVPNPASDCASQLWEPVDAPDGPAGPDPCPSRFEGFKATPRHIRIYEQTLSDDPSAPTPPDDGWDPPLDEPPPAAFIGYVPVPDQPQR